MARQITILLLVAVLSLLGLSYVDACEDECRSEPVSYLTGRYENTLIELTDEIEDPNIAALAKEQISDLVQKLDGRNNVIDKTIFRTFRGPCLHGPGQRSPDELCGSAKSIACFAAWDHEPKSVLLMVHDAVIHAVRKHYASLSQQYPEIDEVVVRGLEKYCPEKCQAWVGEFQTIMLAWEQEEHSEVYGSKVPNCFPLSDGGV
ncbi:hypothetical protein EC968_000572 [Mortierella alpina]|nr:hypothetical protein EC968_000572 [Mortierella alpina]